MFIKEITKQNRGYAKTFVSQRLMEAYRTARGPLNGIFNGKVRLIMVIWIMPALWAPLDKRELKRGMELPAPKVSAMGASKHTGSILKHFWKCVRI